MPERRQPVRETAAGNGREQWNLFALGASVPDRQPPPARLVLLPTAPKVQVGSPLEEVNLVRDEVANMVWGIERRILLPSGH